MRAGRRERKIECLSGRLRAILSKIARAHEREDETVEGETILNDAERTFVTLAVSKGYDSVLRCGYPDFICRDKRGQWVMI